MNCKKCGKREIQEAIVEIDRKYYIFFGCNKCENVWVAEESTNNYVRSITNG